MSKCDLCATELKCYSISTPLTFNHGCVIQVRVVIEEQKVAMCHFAAIVFNHHVFDVV